MLANGKYVNYHLQHLLTHIKYFYESQSFATICYIEANSIEEGMKELDKLSRVLQEPILDDTKIREMVRVDKIPIDEALKDLLAVIKFMTVEHQLTLQSLRIVSVALEKVEVDIIYLAFMLQTYTIYFMAYL